MGTANIILTAQPTTILQARHPRTIISNDGAVTAYLDDQSAVTADVNDFVLRPGERIAWAENVPCWAVGNGATISTSINVERFSTPSPDDWLRYVNSIPPTFPPYVPPSEPVPVVSGGLILIDAGVVSAGPSFNVDLFDSTYDNYRFMFNGAGSSDSTELTINLRDSGVTDTSALYYRQYLYATGGAGAGRVNAATTWVVGYCQASSGFLSLDIFAPNLAAKTNVITTMGSFDLNPVNNMVQNWGSHNSTTVFTGMEIAATIGTLDGSWWLYGWEK